ncbi:pentatricopeptide repeat-containing protein At5g59600-like isoform X1 [Lycium barbarum]|uniref:pentatricopeptide repeat-containing protein At5g59600-like isoform X1 n=2 Tax=Lycium barbarum TaxID=112863 RepID=UPI00293ECAF4|nr:pentatricopeptide repeat-containing protein At5g59600-like isoform X1 [Lycium barbarum]XP_060190941.1 pentatricopeptide repeat-containing protein At5g59600-like isoform X1 [Lycium barbarum]XP_060190942.1 pentatricopeptide repeat-containing protein At5g59600-like isoform X1 [Lycium barbarum]
MNLCLLSPIDLSVTRFGLLLQKCLKAKLLQPCKQIHALMLTSHTDMNVFSLNSKLVGAYASCGDLGSAELVFQRTTNANVFAFNWMMSALAFLGYNEKSIGYFSLLQQSRTIPNKYTCAIVLKACVGLMDLKKGKEVHSMIYRMGFESELSVANALIDMYGKCGNTEYARLVFNDMVEGDIVSWTSMIYSYANMGKIEESFILFEKMRLEGIRPNDFTWNVMIAGYARKGDCDTAFMLFTKMSKEGLTPDLVTWNAMISGYVQSQRSTEALALLQDMLDAGVKPNEVTLTGLLPVCGLTDSACTGKEIHGLVYRLELFANVFVASALIDMYSRCGSVEDAWNVFTSVPFKNVASWNAMIGCYGKHGRVEHAIKLFENMQYEGVLPNEVTLTSLLSACSHGGLVEKGLKIFWSMEESYGVRARKEHYACVIDLLCRVGRLEVAYDIIKDMTIEVTDSIIGAFFSGCKVYARRDLAEKMAKDILQMDLKKPVSLVALSNIYAAEGEWENVENVRNVMKDKGFNKMPGSSWL